MDKDEWNVYRMRNNSIGDRLEVERIVCKSLPHAVASEVWGALEKESGDIDAYRIGSVYPTLKWSDLVEAKR